MPKNKIFITLGVILILLPVLGFPHRWEIFFEVFAGLTIVGLSVWSTVDKKLTQKAKAEKRQAYKRAREQAQIKLVEPNAQGEVGPENI